MKKNKILFFILTFVLVASIMGCTPKQMNRTQTRLGTERPNNVARRDNLTNPNVRPNVSPNVTGRDTIVNPNTGTNMTGRNTIVNPNTTPNTVRRDTLTNPNLRTEIGGNTTNTDLMARANFIAKKVTDLNEVDKASALITGDTALVGVEIKNNIKGHRLKTKNRNNC